MPNLGANTFFLSEMASGEGRRLQNAWRAPVDVFGPGEKSIKSQIQSQTMDYEFSADLWEQACTVVDEVLDIILSELKTQAQKMSENLEIDVRFIRQASARQGLKIVAPDEFDAIAISTNISSLAMGTSIREEISTLGYAVA